MRCHPLLKVKTMINLFFFIITLFYNTSLITKETNVSINTSKVIIPDEVYVESIEKITKKTYHLIANKGITYTISITYKESSFYNISLFTFDKQEIPIHISTTPTKKEFTFIASEYGKYFIEVYNLENTNNIYTLSVYTPLLKTDSYTLREKILLKGRFEKSSSKKIYFIPNTTGVYNINIKVDSNTTHEVYVYNSDGIVLTYYSFDINSLDFSILLLSQKQYTIEIMNNDSSGHFICKTEFNTELYNLNTITPNIMVKENFSFPKEQHWYQILLKANTTYQAILLGNESNNLDLSLLNSTLNILDVAKSKTSSKIIFFVTDVNGVFNFKIEHIYGNGQYSFVILENNEIINE